MEFKQLSDRAVAIRNQYTRLEQQRYGREWTIEELMLGFMKDIGDLAQLVQANEGVRRVDNLDEAIRHELSDCLWSVMVLADKLGVDLEASFEQTMNELERKLQLKEADSRN